MSELPENWKICLLDDVIAVLKNGLVARQNKEGIGLPLSRIETIADGTINTQRIGYAPELKPEDAEDFLLQNDDILFSHINSPAHLGKTAIYKGRPEVLYHGMNLLLIRARADVVNSQYLEYGIRYLRATGVFSLNAQHAVNQASINQRKLRNLEFPLAPLDEQKRIAEKLDSLLTRVDSCQTHLERVPQILKRFRQSVLAKAISGELTAGWRGTETTENWGYERAEDVCEKVQSGGTPREGFIDTAGVPFLKVYNIVNQKIDFHYRPQYITKEIQKGSMSKSQTKPGDVLMNIVGPPLGKVAIVPDEFSEWNINQAITLFRPSERISSKWVYYYLCSGVSVEDVILETKGIVGQVNISLSQCRNFIFPIPPLEEQAEIVRRVESLFAYAERLEARYLSASERVERLTPSLLAKAFRGELVEQDAEDEFAKELVEKVKVGREDVQVKKASPRGKRK